MTMIRRVLAWFFLVVVLVGSFAAPVRSSSRGGGRSVWGAGGGVATAGNDDGYAHGGGKRVWNRRSLGMRTTQPPAPVSNKMRAAAMPAPPSPTTTRV
ncbi:hypothetical protein GQ55_4G317300 [Panicum hallii var. hallii]|uniref:Uncharacterized protein n=2 Tax=Panicum hallii TaxID=206008 RepID=A0A2T7E2B2_9POAL|nr:hypothetical protein PAHAL_4G305300 [Panicum hallii]PUZ61927.1 hypothetical protein GQ55_4G317300 [Panicum hallii var. hallii]